MLVLLFLVGFFAFPQEVELHAPWLTVYDSEGRPRWEISLERLYKTGSGWEGEGVEVRLYWEGELQVSLRAERLAADRLGRVWTINGEISGEAGGLALACREAVWSDGLTLTELLLEGTDLRLSAASARWAQGEEVLLTEIVAESRGWEVTLTTAVYWLDSGLLEGEEAVIRGHGYEIRAAEARLSTREGKLELWEARVVPRP